MIVQTSYRRSLLLSAILVLMIRVFMYFEPIDFGIGQFRELTENKDDAIHSNFICPESCVI
jgi:hypothetical protein